MRADKEPLPAMSSAPGVEHVPRILLSIQALLLRNTMKKEDTATVTQTTNCPAYALQRVPACANINISNVLREYACAGWHDHKHLSWLQNSASNRISRPPSPKQRKS